MGEESHALFGLDKCQRKGLISPEVAVCIPILAHVCTVAWRFLSDCHSEAPFVLMSADWSVLV